MPGLGPNLLAVFRVDATLDLHRRLYHALCLVTALFGLVVIPLVNLPQSLPAVITVISMCGGAVGLLLYAAARSGHEYPTLLFLDVMAALVLAWFPNGGSHGSVVFYLPAAALIPVVFARGPSRLLQLSSVFATYAVLLLVEWFWPSLSRPYATTLERAFDMLSGFGVGLAGLVVVLWIVLGEYRAERQRLEDSIAALAESREQISRSLLEAAHARAQLATLIDSTDDLVWVEAADEYRLVLFNAAFARYFAERFGHTVRPGMTPDDLLPAQAAEWWRTTHNRVLADGPFSTEYTTGDGRLLLLACNPVETEGRRIGVSVFARDITARIRAEEERARLEQHLLQAQKMESLGSLAGGVAHDFSNMMAGIMGHADLLLATETDPVRRESLGAIVRAATRSGDLTRKLLAFARRGENVVEPIDLRDVVREVVATLRPSFHPRLVTTLALDSSWTIDGDPAQIHQALVNLCINANEAMPKGGTLSIALTGRDLDDAEARARDVAPGEYLEICVTDTGTGMSHDVARRAFEPFFTTKDQAELGSAGLGLSTVYGVVQLHHGSVTLASAPGRGTTVSVLLPRGAKAGGAGAGDGRPRGAGLILVVDDEALLRDAATTTLRRLGYAAVTARDGEWGIELFRSRHAEFDGVLLDLKMPGKTGSDVFDAMRNIDPSVPILVCWGDGDREEAEGLMSRGAAGLLTKPFKIAELSAQLVALGARPGAP